MSLLVRVLAEVLEVERCIRGNRSAATSFLAKLDFMAVKNGLGTQ